MPTIIVNKAAADALARVAQSGDAYAPPVQCGPDHFRCQIDDEVHARLVEKQAELGLPDFSATIVHLVEFFVAGSRLQ